VVTWKNTLNKFIMKKALIFYGLLGGAVYLYLKNKKKKKEYERRRLSLAQEDWDNRFREKTAIPEKAILINNVPIAKPEYHHVPSFNPRGHKAYMDRFLVTPERQIVSAL